VSDPNSLTGLVRVVGPGQSRSVLLRVGDQDHTVVGDLVAEIAKLASCKVELLGQSDGLRFLARGYRILEVTHGITPWVGTVVALRDGVALADGEGSPIPLSLSPPSKARLLRVVGGKIWVSGKKLLSGELQVARFGILREAPPGASHP
jgi:hypothetical protein